MMGKNKKKKAQMYSNFLAFKAGQGSQNAANRTNVVIVNKPLLPTLLGQSKPPAAAPQFQTPHGEQDKLTELLDDNSPGAPPSPAPLHATHATHQGRSAPAPAPARAGGLLSASKWRPLEDATSIQLNITKDPKRPKLTVVEGSASGIQLGLDKSKGGPSHQLWLKLKSQEELQSSTEKPPTTKPHKSMPPAPHGPPPVGGVASPTVTQPPPGLAEPVTPAAAAAVGKRRAPQWVLATTPPPPAKQLASPVLHNVGSGWPRSMSAGSPAAALGPAPGAPLRVRTTSLEGAAEAPPQPYSPSDVYTEAMINEEREEAGAGARRVSAFRRLGPAPPAAPAAPALEPLLAASTHEVVLKYRDLWPHRAPIVPVRMASARTSKSAMLLQTEYMEETYSRDNRFVLVTVTGFPENWSKEDVLDAILESVKGKSFIPCFIEMSRAECRFLVVRCRAALLHIHKYGFVVRGAGQGQGQGGAELVVSLGCIQLTLAQLDFVPRLVLRRVTQLRLSGTRLDLSRFTRAPDLSHFVYFPLWRATNQAELVQLQGAAPWADLTHLDLSHNNITSLSGLELGTTCPRLRSLDLGHNRLESVTSLLGARALPLHALVLEGNPLCRDYIQQEHYLAVLTLLYPELLSLDGVPVHRRGTLPTARRQYSVSQSGAELAERVLSALLPVLARDTDASCAHLYHERATLRVTASPRLRYSGAFVSPACRALLRCGAWSGRGDIARALQRWPPLQHDPAALTLDVMHHSETATLLVVGGLAHVPCESDGAGEGGEGEVFAFTRSLVVGAAAAPHAHAVLSELLHWDVPARALLAAHPHIRQMKPKAHSYLSLDDPPDADLRQKLLTVFMQITELDKKPSERCLEAKDWNIKNALEYFVTLLKLDHLEPIMKD